MIKDDLEVFEEDGCNYSSWFTTYTTEGEAVVAAKQKAKRSMALFKATTKKAKAAVLADPDISPLHVWCPLRSQWIDTIVCARMQSQKRIVRKCKSIRCEHMASWWSEALTKARKKEDPNDDSLGYLKTQSYKLRKGTKKRKKRSDVGKKRKAGKDGTK